MFKSTIITAAAVAAFAFAASAHAGEAAKAPKYYVGAGYAYNQTGEDEGFHMLGGTAGVQVSPHVAFEAEAALGVSDKSYTVSGYNVKVKVENTYAAYVVGIWPGSENVDYTARLGYGSMKLSGSTSGISVTDSVSGPSFGVGMRYFPKGGANGFRGDITHFSFGDDGEADVFQVAYVRKF